MVGVFVVADEGYMVTGDPVIGLLVVLAGGNVVVT